MSNDIATTTTEPGGQMMEMPAESGMMARWNSNARRLATSLDTETEQGKLDYLRALTTKPPAIADHIGKPIEVKDWLIHAVELKGRTEGEVIEALRLVLVGPKGELWCTFSKVICDNWASVAEMTKRKTMNPPIEVTFTKVKLPGGGYYLQIHEVKFGNSIETTARPKAKNAAQ